MIGLGLNDEKDITLKGLEAIKNCDLVYLESYTSKLACNIEDLEQLYGKKIILADRKLVEQNADDILQTDKDVAFKELSKNKSIHYDPLVVDAGLKIFKEN